MPENTKMRIWHYDLTFKERVGGKQGERGGPAGRGDLARVWLGQVVDPPAQHQAAAGSPVVQTEHCGSLVWHPLFAAPYSVHEVTTNYERKQPYLSYQTLKLVK